MRLYTGENCHADVVVELDGGDPPALYSAE